MTSQDDLATALQAWFRAEASQLAPRSLAEAVVARTRAVRPRPRRFGLQRDPYRGSPWARPSRSGLLIGVAGVAVLLVAAIAVVGGPMRGLLIVAPSPSVQVSTSVAPTRAPNVAPSFEPRLSPSEAGELAVAYWEREAIGVARLPIRITKIEPLAANTFYDTSGSGGFEYEVPTWVVEADQGAFVSCGSECAVSDHAIAFIEDATATLSGDSLVGATMPLPNRQFRRMLADNGLAYSPGEAPSVAIVDSATVVAGLDPQVFARQERRLVGPLYGLVTRTQASSTPLPISPDGPGARAIWWVEAIWVTKRSASQGMLTPGPWVAIDAVTGAVLMRN